MATKEDILEQVVGEFLLSRGYFVRHNIKFRPRTDHPDHDTQKDSNHSDIDVLGYNPNKTGSDRVVAVSCKSWQSGFRVATKISELENDKTVGGRKAWQAFRELMVPKWTEAFIDTIEAATGTRQFIYATAVTRIRGDKESWETYPRFQAALAGNPVWLLSFESMVTELNADPSRTLAGTEIGRLLQLFRAAGMKPITTNQ
ncbi:hypothetical protein L0666_08510 [Octadecabacter sp. CECT 8868]|uniref:hypothetical protein n=1 Tax=Octadecabacter algicola TaxID=2909342 RepID=UPI001F3E86EE|nr:hypothetical protein [Octadecabacter algicola]MCF2905027.1 hypothetical protein [Octadecabacter algicola]